MAGKTHQYQTDLKWTGNQGTGTNHYSEYLRDHIHSAPGKPPFPGSSDPSFRGDPSRYNPEEMLVSSLSACHMLWFLHLCSVNKIVVTAYEDRATGEMAENKDGSGQFTGVTLNPMITLADSSQQDKADTLHVQANKLCFIARSVNFPVHHKATYHHE